MTFNIFESKETNQPLDVVQQLGGERLRIAERAVANLYVASGGPSREMQQNVQWAQEAAQASKPVAHVVSTEAVQQITGTIETHHTITPLSADEVSENIQKLENLANGALDPDAIRKYLEGAYENV